MCNLVGGTVVHVLGAVPTKHVFDRTLAPPAYQSNTKAVVCTHIPTRKTHKVTTHYKQVGSHVFVQPLTVFLQCHKCDAYLRLPLLGFVYTAVCRAGTSHAGLLYRPSWATGLSYTGRFHMECICVSTYARSNPPPPHTHTHKRTHSHARTYTYKHTYKHTQACTCKHA